MGYYSDLRKGEVFFQDWWLCVSTHALVFFIDFTFEALDIMSSFSELKSTSGKFILSLKIGSVHQ